MGGHISQNSDWDIARQYGCAHGATGLFSRMVLNGFDLDETAITAGERGEQQDIWRTPLDTAISHIVAQVVVRRRRESRDLNGIKVE